MSRDPIKPNELLDYINDSTKKYIEQLKEDNVRWTCKHTAAEQKYQTQSNVIAELRGRVEELQEELEMLENENEDVLERSMNRKYKLEELGDSLKTYKAASIQWESQAVMAEEREQKLKKELEDTRRYLSEGTFDADICCEFIEDTLSTLYPLDREDTNDN